MINFRILAALLSCCLLVPGNVPGDEPGDTPPGMVWIPAGEFSAGSGESSREGPVRQETVPGFFIDIHEVTNGEYKKFKRDHFFPPASVNKPATCVTWPEAEAYAEWVGKRLPTGFEWEKAARGTDGRLYPWGNDPCSAKLNSVEAGIAGTVPVDSYPGSVSPFGLYNVAGNVWEWVDDACRERLLEPVDVYESEKTAGEEAVADDTPRENVESDGGPERVKSKFVDGEEGQLVRGGSWDVSRFICRTSNSMCLQPDARRPDVGFRCVKDAPSR